VPDRKPKRERAQHVSHQRMISRVNSPSAVEGDPGSYKHQDSTKVLHGAHQTFFKHAQRQMMTV
jgi:hypothetical protein